MKMRTHLIGQLILMFWLCSAGSVSFAEHGVKLYTPFTKISVPPGESIDYNIDVLNNGEEAQKIDIVVTGIPSSWTYSIKSGGWSVQQLAVLPGEKKTLNLKVDVPMRVNKGNHSFRVLARNFDELPLVVNVSEQGTFKTEFTSDQVNMQGHAKASFTFSTKLKNMTGEKQLYSLQANAPRGWEVIFKPNYNQGTAVEVEPNATTNISIDVKPPYNVSAGTYKIPIRAINNATSAENELEVVITGTYEMELTTPRGILSTSLTAGKEKKIEMLVRNTGSSPLSNIRFAASKPQSWEVSFSPDTLRLLEPGASAVVNASIKAYDKAIPGDYVSNITANTPEVSSTAAFRISVKTPLLWGWLGIMIIAVSVGFIYFLFRKYGRR